MSIRRKAIAAASRRPHPHRGVCIDGVATSRKRLTATDKRLPPSRGAADALLLAAARKDRSLLAAAETAGLLNRMMGVFMAPLQYKQRQGANSPYGGRMDLAAASRRRKLPRCAPGDNILGHMARMAVAQNMPPLRGGRSGRTASTGSGFFLFYHWATLGVGFWALPFTVVSHQKCWIRSLSGGGAPPAPPLRQNACFGAAKSGDYREYQDVGAAYAGRGPIDSGAIAQLASYSGAPVRPRAP